MSPGGYFTVKYFPSQEVNLLLLTVLRYDILSLDMLIENRLPKKQKAQSGISASSLISIKEVDALCRRHQYNHLVVTAPARTPILAGVKIRTAEAVQTFQSYYRPFVVRSQGRFHNDLPFLPNRM